METTTGKRIVSKGQYIAMKTFALGLSGSFVLCLLVQSLILLNFPFVEYKARQLDALCQTRGCSEEQEYNQENTSQVSIGLLIFLFVPSLPVAYGCCRASRKSWNAVSSGSVVTHRNKSGMCLVASVAWSTLAPAGEGVWHVHLKNLYAP